MKFGAPAVAPVPTVLRFKTFVPTPEVPVFGNKPLAAEPVIGNKLLAAEPPVVGNRPVAAVPPVIGRKPLAAETVLGAIELVVLVKEVPAVGKLLTPRSG